MKEQILKELEINDLRKQLVNHQFFQNVKKDPLTKKKVEFFLSQYYYPINYFTYFLSKLISILPTIEMQTFVSKILWQELGEGNPDNAHLTLFISTMKNIGFVKDSIVNAKSLTETDQLVNGYKDSTNDYLTGLGFLYGTEVIDITIVQGLGEAVSKVTGEKNLPWVEIHIKQEPDHVDSSERTLKYSFTEKEKKIVIQSAEKMWRLWINFFTAIDK